jgi:hypothetical protein
MGRQHIQRVKLVCVKRQFRARYCGRPFGLPVKVERPDKILRGVTLVALYIVRPPSKPRFYC